MDEFIWKFVIFVDMLGFAALTERHEVDYDEFRALDNLTSTDFVRSFSNDPTRRRPRCSSFGASDQHQFFRFSVLSGRYVTGRNVSFWTTDASPR
ncbi:MAG: hypothetical protein DMF88_10650 [Acidobacteria bacterium]|nr:MAG: hypothetical protein DMF88_10650 [Acidobacteriota bacterium]